MKFFSLGRLWKSAGAGALGVLGCGGDGRRFEATVGGRTVAVEFRSSTPPPPAPPTQAPPPSPTVPSHPDIVPCRPVDRREEPGNAFAQPPGAPAPARQPRDLTAEQLEEIVARGVRRGNEKIDARIRAVEEDMKALKSVVGSNDARTRQLLLDVQSGLQGVRDELNEKVQRLESDNAKLAARVADLQIQFDAEKRRAADAEKPKAAEKPHVAEKLESEPKPDRWHHAVAPAPAPCGSKYTGLLSPDWSVRWQCPGCQRNYKSWLNPATLAPATVIDE